MTKKRKRRVNREVVAKRRAVGTLLSKYRNERQRTLRELANQTRSAAFLSYLERGERSFTQDTLLRISKALDLSADEYRTLMKTAGFSTFGEAPRDERPQNWSEKLQRFTKEAEQTLTLSGNAQALFDDLNNALQQHRDNREIRKAIVPIADWQSGLLPPETLRKMIRPLLDEITEARITSVAILTANLSSSFVGSLRQSYSKLNLHCIPTQDPLKRGLGSAILAAREFLGNHDFAMAVPDIQILQTGTGEQSEPPLKRMQAVYARSGCSVIAIKRTPLSFIRSGAVVVTGEPLENNVTVKPIKTIEARKATAGEHYVLGRYILTNQILDILRFFALDEDGAIRLAPVLQKLLPQQTIYAVDFSGECLDGFAVPSELLVEIVNYLTRDPRDSDVDQNLDALVLHLCPWGREVRTLENLIGAFEGFTKLSTDSEILRTMRVTLAALHTDLVNEPFPFNFWAACFQDVVEVLDFLPKAARQYRERFVLDFKKFIPIFLESLQSGHKNQASHSLWFWTRELKEHQRALLVRSPRTI